MNAGLSSSQVSLDFPRNLSLSSDAKVHRPIRVMCMSFPSDVLYWVNFSAKALGTFVCEGSFESGKPSHTLVSSLFTGSSCFFCAEDDQWFQATTFARTSSSFTLSLSTFIQGKSACAPLQAPDDTWGAEKLHSPIIGVSRAGLPPRKNSVGGVALAAASMGAAASLSSLGTGAGGGAEVRSGGGGAAAAAAAAAAAVGRSKATTPNSPLQQQQRG